MTTEITGEIHADGQTAFPSSAPSLSREPEEMQPDLSTRKKRKSGSGAQGSTAKRHKVNHACLYCRRSHMTCDEGRPCQRCIKRDIGHLCHDEPKPKSQPPETSPASSTHQHSPRQNDTPTPEDTLMPEPSTILQPGAQPFPFPPVNQNNPTSWSLMFPSQESTNNEFSVLSEFLESLEDQSFFNGGTPSSGNFARPSPAGPLDASAYQPIPSTSQVPYPPMYPSTGQIPDSQQPTFYNNQPQPQPQPQLLSSFQSNQVSPLPQYSSPSARGDSLQPPESQAAAGPSQPHLPHIDVLPPSTTTKTERFLLTAADQEDGTRDERLSRVIQAKYEAGMLKPFNYVKGYARLSRWMEQSVSPASRMKILQPLSVLRPRFRAIAQTLTDIDLVFIEEAFERLLLDYDRVFSAFGVPACLWRRTGEIYKGNKEFAELVGVDVDQLRDGRLCIYELMDEVSAVNYFEKYVHVAFDTGQKAVLTSCVMRYKPAPASFINFTPPAPSSAATIGKKQGAGAGAVASGGGGGIPIKKKPRGPAQQGFINCCFSFTIQRDAHGIPTLIAGNFIRH